MPMYTYHCQYCKTTFDTIVRIEDRDEPQECAGCGSKAGRCFGKEKQGCAVDATMKENERWSWSMGVHVNQIPEMMRRYPGSEYHPVTGQLKVSSRQDKLRKMKERELTEFN